MPENYPYTVKDVLEELNGIDFEDEPDDEASDMELKLRELYRLPNIDEDESALKAVVEYVASKLNPETAYLYLETELPEYAKLFVQFYPDWRAVAEEHLESTLGNGIETYYQFIDLNALGKSVAPDLGGYFEVSDGRIACFNKKEGE